MENEYSGDDESSRSESDEVNYNGESYSGKNYSSKVVKYQFSCNCVVSLSSSSTD